MQTSWQLSFMCACGMAWSCLLHARSIDMLTKFAWITSPKRRGNPWKKVFLLHLLCLYLQQSLHWTLFWWNLFSVFTCNNAMIGNISLMLLLALQIVGEDSLASKQRQNGCESGHQKRTKEEGGSFYQLATDQQLSIGKISLQSSTCMSS